MRGQDEMQRSGIGMTSQRTRERLIQRLYEEGLSNARVLEVIRRTPRHLFVDEALAHRAYEDTALPIGHNQTISQPYMVGRMTELLLAAGPLDKVLEIGTGSGYQTAVLAQLVERVFSVERIQVLQDRAKERLAELKLRNVVFRWGDGWEGWNALLPVQRHHCHRRRRASAAGLARSTGSRRTSGHSGRQWRCAATAADRA